MNAWERMGKLDELLPKVKGHVEYLVEVTDQFTEEGSAAAGALNSLRERLKELVIATYPAPG